MLPEQDELWPPAHIALGSIDYRTWRQRLERINEMVRSCLAIDSGESTVDLLLPAFRKRRPPAYNWS